MREFFNFSMSVVRTPMAFVIPEANLDDIDETLISELLEKDTERFLTHDNGGRPFLVVHEPETLTVWVLERIENHYVEEEIAYTVLVKRYENIVAFLPGVPQEDFPEFKGNSVLVQLDQEGRFVHVGNSIFEFRVSDDLPITKLYSFVGNSDVSYPVALSDSCAYFMLDHVFLSRTQFPDDIDWLNGYKAFYALKPYPKEPTFKDLIIVQERL